MTKKFFIGGNWKMHGDYNRLSEIAVATDAFAASHPSLEVVLFPPFVYVAEMMRSLRDGAVAVGAQNMSEHEQGAYTGEIAAAMLEETGCHHVLLGHSERRRLYGETDAQVAAKFAQAVRRGMSSVLCIGETLAQRRAEQARQVLEAQLETVRQQVPVTDWQQVVIAYEPVWAIGTGVSAKAEEAQQAHAWIRAWLARHDERVASRIRIIYGGSVKPDTAGALFAEPDIDGGLIGGASLDRAAFLGILSAVPSLKQ